MNDIKVKLLRTQKEKAVGLLGAEKPYPVLIKTRFEIHTFGLSFPIAVLILDRNSKVVKVCKHLAPNRIFVWPPVFDTVLELPVGGVKLNL